MLAKSQYGNVQNIVGANTALRDLVYARRVLDEYIGLITEVEVEFLIGNLAVELLAMSMAKQQRRIDRFAWAMVISAIALVFMLSIAITVNPGHGFDQITLALPVFFVFLFLAILIDGWVQIEGFFLEPKAPLSTSLTRGPPA